MSEHVASPKSYFAVFFTLIALTLLTTGVAFIDLGSLNTVVAMVIAIFKASLVILFFMHLRYSSQMNKLVLVGTFFWLALLIGVTMSDVISRGWIPAAPHGLQTTFRTSRS